MQGYIHLILDQFILRPAHPRQLPIEHFKEYQANRPNITLRAILLAFKLLRRHIERRTHHSRIQLRIRNHTLRKPKIRNLYDPVMQQQVLRFYVAMDDAVGDQFDKTVADVF